MAPADQLNRRSERLRPGLVTPARFELDGPIPATLPVGALSAVCCRGSCVDGDELVASAAIIADGARHRVKRLPGGEFFTTFVLDAGPAPRTLHLEAAIGLAGGSERIVPLARIEVVAPTAPAVEHAPLGPETIAICMATFEPDIELFRAQFESLQGQTDADWVCLISDDCSAPERFAQIEALVAQDHRFAISRSERRLGFYRNFERALMMVPPGAKLVALCDQDDRWHPPKLAVLRASIGSAALVYSDQRLVSADGRVLRVTLWKGRANNHTNLTSLLIANTITGAATLMRRDVVELALPFPEAPGYQFHDHWIGLVALSAGAIGYVEHPLYDYVQHGGAVFGDVTHGATRPRRNPHSRRQRWRAAYLYGFLSREVQAQTLLARCGPRLTPRKRRALRWFIDSGRSPFAFAWLVARSLRSLIGRNETLSSELELAQGIIWRWLAALPLAGGRRPAGPPPLDAFSQERLRRWRAAL